MKRAEGYVAKETFVFPLFCLVVLACNIYWGCDDGWPVGAIIGALFFGVFVSIYAGKYICFGRDCLRINSDGIEVKEWGKTTKHTWMDIEKCTVFYAQSYGTFFFRILSVSLSPAKKRKYVNVRLSGKFCRNKSVIGAIERFGGPDVFDRQSSHRHNKYLAAIFLATIVCAILIFIFFELL